MLAAAARCPRFVPDPAEAAAAGLVKICGLTDEPAVHAALNAGADLVGLVFVEGSRRFVRPVAAGPLARVAARAGTPIVGLFQNPALSEIEEVLESVPLDFIQLHGTETHDDVARIGAGFGLPIIKAVGVSGAGDLYQAAGYEADLMLYDAKPPRGAAAAGGHGAAFDWEVLWEAEHRLPWLLAGGLTAETVADAVGAVGDIEGFRGLDVSSGVESAPGIKDAAAVRRFVRAARAAMAGAQSEDDHDHG